MHDFGVFRGFYAVIFYDQFFFQIFFGGLFVPNSVTLNGFLIVCFAAIFAGYFFWEQPLIAI